MGYRGPEVILKIASYSKTEAQLREYMSSIPHDGELNLTLSDGMFVFYTDIAIDCICDWCGDVNPVTWRYGQRGRPSRITANMILTVKGANREELEKGTNTFLEKCFPNHDWAIATHCSPQPSIYLMIRNLGNDGRRLHIPRGQIYEWRKAFAQALQEHGVKADANTRCRKKAESTEEAAPNADKKQE